MRKATLLFVAICLLIASVSYAAPTTGECDVQLYGLFNWISAPLIPFDPNPRNIINPGGPFQAWQNMLYSSDSATWLEPTTQSLINFPNDWDNFPNIVMGDGYSAYVAAALGEMPADSKLAYQGVNISDTDAYISLPGRPEGNGGWHWIGIPYPTDKQVLFYDIVVTDGSESHTMLDLLGTGTDWLSLGFISLDAASQSVTTIPDSGDYLVGGQMYKVMTYKSNLALILPHPL